MLKFKVNVDKETKEATVTCERVKLIKAPFFVDFGEDVNVFINAIYCITDNAISDILHDDDSDDEYRFEKLEAFEAATTYEYEHVEPVHKITAIGLGWLNTKSIPYEMTDLYETCKTYAYDYKGVEEWDDTRKARFTQIKKDLSDATLSIISRSGYTCNRFNYSSKLVNDIIDKMYHTKATTSKKYGRTVGFKMENIYNFTKFFSMAFCHAAGIKADEKQAKQIATF